MKKKQLKWISLAAAAVLGASVLLSGCGGSSSSSGTESAAEETEETTEEAEAAEENQDEAQADAAQTEMTAETGTATEDAAAADTADDTASADLSDEAVTITLFAAKSLNTVMEEDVIRAFNEKYPNVTVIGSYDSSGTLQTQIQEGAECDVFFSAAQKQMNTLEEEGFVVEGTRHNVVNNQVVVVTYPGSGTSVTGLENLADAANMALADGSVPVGKYTRQALVNAGMIEAPADGDVSLITTEEVSAALGGLEINECANVGAVTAAVAEGSNEVGTVYYSDTYGHEDSLEILQTVSYDLTGDVIYPVAQIVNDNADDAQAAAARAFAEYVSSEEVKEIFQKYYFDTDVE